MSGHLDLADADPAALGRRSARGAAATFAAQGIRLVLQFRSKVALARLLTPAQFGIVAMVAPLVGLVQLFAELGQLAWGAAGSGIVLASFVAGLP